MSRLKFIRWKNKFKLWCVLHPLERFQKNMCERCPHYEHDTCPDITLTVRPRRKLKYVSWHREPDTSKWTCIEFIKHV